MTNFNSLLIEIARKDTALESVAEVLYTGNHTTDAEIILDSNEKHFIYGIKIDASYRVKTGLDKSNFYQLTSNDIDDHIIAQTQWRLIPTNQMMTNSLHSMIFELVSETAQILIDEPINCNMKENQQAYYSYHIQEAYTTISKDDYDHQREVERLYMKEAELLGDYGCKIWLEREFGPMD